MHTIPIVFDVAALNRILGSWSSNAELAVGYAERTAKDQFRITKEEPGFSSIGGLKDATHIQNLAKQSGCAMPVVDLVVDNLQQIKDRGDAEALDWASLSLIAREKAGIEDKQHLLRKA